MRPSARVAVVAVTSGGAAVLATRAARALPASLREPWERTNHAGRPVTLLEGPAWVLGAVTGVALAGRQAAVSGGSRSRRGVREARGSADRSGTTRAAALVVTTAAGALGALDDLAGSTSSKGLKGHLGALAHGELTTGAIKVAGLAVTGVVGAVLSDRTGRRSGGCQADLAGRRGLLASAVGGAVIAGSANAANLFDLRPGRALKVVLAGATPLALGGSAPAAAALGSSAGVIGDDLAGRSMLGDTGANAAGALVGLAVVERTTLRGRLTALGVLTALTLVSERVSFTKVIEGNDILRGLDEWGRPAPTPSMTGTYAQTQDDARRCTMTVHP